MDEPTTSRPYMPGYCIKAPDEGSGLLPWAWAVEQLTASRNYWVATVGPDSQPHAMPVWGAWLDGALWFSTGGRSRKRRNLAHERRCAIATEDAERPVMVQGMAEVVGEPALLDAFLAATNAKYGTDIRIDFLDPDVNATVRVPPTTVIALQESDFDGSPTRWSFAPGRACSL